MNIEKLAKQLDSIIESSYDGLWICDGKGKVVRINKASERINGIKAKQFLGKRMEDIVKEGLIDRSVTIEVLKNGAAVTIMQILKDGRRVLVTGNPFFDEKGKISLVVVNERDITELDRLRSELIHTRALTEEYRTELSNIYRREDFTSKIVLRSPSMIRVIDKAMKAAEVDATVLIEGESGVGKGLIARMIHETSKRRDGPFIRVDCGAIPEHLVESELFGYDGGAFTGARTAGKPGHFELAEGGTLFLDEIGEIQLRAQVKLLRFMEETEIIHVGGTAPKKVNARVIAATNRSLSNMVNQGLFREDLFFRFSVIPIRVPPLRERLEDVPALVQFFLEKFNNKYSARRRVSPRSLDRICDYPFPGNVRELGNLVEQLVVLSPHDNVDVEDLPSHICRQGARGIHSRSRILRDEWNLDKAIEDLEKEIIVNALRTFGSQRKAAGPLGIHQSTLARKAKRLGMRVDAKMHHDA